MEIPQGKLLDPVDHADLLKLVRESKFMRRRKRPLVVFETLLKNNRESRAVRIKALSDEVGEYITQAADRLREVLRELFDGELRGAGASILVSEGSHGAKLEDNPHIYTLWVCEKSKSEHPIGLESALKRFWKCHAASAVPGCIIYGQPFFLKNKDNKGRDTFLRNTEVNSQTDALAEGLSGKPDDSYLRRGEVLALLELSNYFAGQLKPMKPIESRKGETLSLLRSKVPDQDSSLVIVGNSLSNGALAYYQTTYDFPYYSQGLDIYRWKNPRTRREGIPYAIRERLDDRTLAPVLLSRRPGALEGNSWITMLATDSGRAMKRLGEILCSASHMERLFQDSRLSEWPSDWPDGAFQLVLEIVINRIDGKEDSGTEWRLKKAWRPTSKHLPLL